MSEEKKSPSRLALAVPVVFISCGFVLMGIYQFFSQDALPKEKELLHILAVGSFILGGISFSKHLGFHRED